MSNYPSTIDSPSTLYTPADAFSTKSLETTATVGIGSGDSTISVASTSGGFADAYGVLSIDDELVIYTGLSGAQFTGCQRGAFGTSAASHANGVTVRANVVAGFITALQSAVVAIETEIGTAAARNYVQKAGAVTITGLKTFQDGAAFGTGNIAGTGLMRLPNLGAVQWRNAVNSGDLGMALNASDHLAMDAIVDFAGGQTFSIPDATTTTKGIVQIDSAGGLAVAAGVLSLANTAVTPGTYTKLTVDARGRATAGASLVAGDLPAHTHSATDITSGTLLGNCLPIGLAISSQTWPIFQVTGIAPLSWFTKTNATADQKIWELNASNDGYLLMRACSDDYNHSTSILYVKRTSYSISFTAINPDAGNVLVGTTTDNATDKLQVNGSILATTLKGSLACSYLTGTLALARGGAAADLSGTGPGFLKQASLGAAITVAALASGDLPSHTHTSAQISDATSSGLANMIAKRDATGGASFGWLSYGYIVGGYNVVSADSRNAVYGAYFPRTADLNNVAMLDYQDEFALADLQRSATITVSPAASSGVPAYMFTDDANSLVWNPAASPFPITVEIDCTGNPVSAEGNGGYNVGITMRGGTQPTGMKIESWDPAGGGAYTTVFDDTTLSTYSSYNVWICPRFFGPTPGYGIHKIRLTFRGTNPLPDYFRIQRVILYHATSRWDRWHLRRDGGTIYGNLAITGALTLSATGPGFLKQTGAGAAVTVAAIAESDVTSLVSDLAGKAATSHTHAATDIVSGTLDNARTSATANATASTLVLRDGSAGASFGYVAANSQWAYLDSHFQSLESGAYQTVGGPFENMAKYSEDFTVATWDKNGGSCSATANTTTAPDGNTTAETITAVTATPIIQQQIAGLVDGGQYTFYVWGNVASGTKQVSLAIVNNAYGAYVAGPTSITLTTAWQRFKITGTLAGGQTGLWIVVRQYISNGDNWTSGAIYLWGACLQQGNDPKIGYARTWASQTAAIPAGIACGPVVVSAKDAAESPLRVYGPGSNLADHTLLEITAGGELILAGGTGNGYRLAELMGASSPSGWAGVIKVKNPAGSTAGYLLLYRNP